MEIEDSSRCSAPFLYFKNIISHDAIEKVPMLPSAYSYPRTIVPNSSIDTRIAIHSTFGTKAHNTIQKPKEEKKSNTFVAVASEWKGLVTMARGIRTPTDPLSHLGMCPDLHREHQHTFVSDCCTYHRFFHNDRAWCATMFVSTLDLFVLGTMLYPIQLEKTRL